MKLVWCKVEEESKDPEPLRMEHFIFPLGTWLIGILLSVLCLIVEIIFHCVRKRQTDVPLAGLGDPGVAQSTKESEVELISDVEDI